MKGRKNQIRESRGVTGPYMQGVEDHLKRIEQLVHEPFRAGEA